MKTQLLPHNQVEAAGFAKFNDGQHLCVEVPDGRSTISVKLSDGRQITFAFCPYEKDGRPQCIDIHDNGGKPLPNFVNKGQTLYQQQFIAFSGAGPDAFRTKADDARPTTLIALLLHEPKWA